MENLHLIVGLGNPGRRYAHTRHNAGFMAAERFGRRWQASWSLEKKFNARIARVERNACRVILCLPQTYMNASGESVGALAAYYKLAADCLMVVVDDADLPLGEVRLRPGGGTGGHHGLESIEQHWGSSQFARLRVGIGRAELDSREITDYVLSSFGAAETELLGKVLDRVCDQMECWLRQGIAQAMNQFNGVLTN